MIGCIGGFTVLIFPVSLITLLHDHIGHLDTLIDHDSFDKLPE
jgi:hypothetical protein